MGLLWGVVAVILVLWILGLLMEIGGNLIHILLIVALIAIVWNLLTGRRAG